MSRVPNRRAEGRCPGCGNVPSAEERDAFMCGCGAILIPENSVKANPETESLLQGSGFVFEDIDGRKYYVGPLSHIVYVYSDGSWDSDKAGTEQSLGNYLAWVRSKLGDLA